jgi:hypothetical protein
MTWRQFQTTWVLDNQPAVSAAHKVNRENSSAQLSTAGSSLVCEERGPGDGAVLIGMTKGELAVIVYSSPMTRNRPELPGFYRLFETVNPVVAQ